MTKKAKQTRKKISEAMKGKKSHRYNHTIRTFRNTNTSEVFVGTQYNFINKYALHKGCVSQVINGKRKSHKGWVLV